MLLRRPTAPTYKGLSANKAGVNTGCGPYPTGTQPDTYLLQVRFTWFLQWFLRVRKRPKSNRAISPSAYSFSETGPRTRHGGKTRGFKPHPRFDHAKNSKSMFLPLLLIPQIENIQNREVSHKVWRETYRASVMCMTFVRVDSRKVGDEVHVHNHDTITIQ